MKKHTTAFIRKWLHDNYLTLNDMRGYLKRCLGEVYNNDRETMKRLQTMTAEEMKYITRFN